MAVKIGYVAEAPGYISVDKNELVTVLCKPFVEPGSPFMYYVWVNVVTANPSDDPREGWMPVERSQNHFKEVLTQ